MNQIAATTPEAAATHECLARLAMASNALIQAFMEIDRMGLSPEKAEFFREAIMAASRNVDRVFDCQETGVIQ